LNETIRKSAQISGAEVTEADLKLINKLSIRPLTAEEVFVFRVAMCDNEVDRDFEVFPTSALKGLAKLYKGKTVIANHMWKSENQVARIFETEVVPDDARQTQNGETYAQLVARCYMLRTDTNKDLIAEIEAGIKKEVSVGCAMQSAVCSICGMDNRKTWCQHYNGKEYDGKLCYFKLEGARDAYELSFVAVPAQREAGIIKAYGAEKPKEPPAPNPDEAREKSKAEADVKIRLADAFLFAKKNRNTEVTEE